MTFWKSSLTAGRALVRLATGLQINIQAQPTTNPDLAARISALEKNERDQAPVVKAMAEQVDQLGVGAMKLHLQLLWLAIAVGVVGVIAVVALVVAFAR